MTLEDYRRDMEAKLRAAQDAARLDQARRAATQRKHLGAAMASADSAQLEVPTTLEDRGADPASRIEALGAYLASAAAENRKLEVLFRYLSDKEAPAALRLSALKRLQALSFTSPGYSDWRKHFVEALRVASEADDAGLRRAAFELLANLGDRPSQDALIEGLENPERARVPAVHALRLLADNPHTRVTAIARKFADRAQEETVRLEALRVLAADASFKGQFATILADVGEDASVRMLAATALSGLDRDLLRNVAAGLAQPASASLLSLDAQDPVRRHLRGLLERR